MPPHLASAGVQSKKPWRCKFFPTSKRSILGQVAFRAETSTWGGGGEENKKNKKKKGRGEPLSNCSRHHKADLQSTPRDSKRWCPPNWNTMLIPPQDLGSQACCRWHPEYAGSCLHWGQRSIRQNLGGGVNSRQMQEKHKGFLLP